MKPTVSVWPRLLHETSVEEAIAEASPGKQGWMNLASRGLPEVPPAVLHTPKVRVLFLQDNELEDIPDELCERMTELRALMLGENKLTRMPVRKLSAAEHLC